MRRSSAYFPSISIVVPTLNSASEIDYFIKVIRGQTYPQNKIKIIFVDGGSTDDTLKLAHRYKVKVIKNPYILAEPAVSLGMQNSKTDLIMVLATDNIFNDKDAIEKMVNVFRDDEIFAALPKQDYDKTDNLLTRYHNTFTDPFNHFVYGYASNARTFHKVYKTIKSNSEYDVYDFKSSTAYPMISFSQGFTIRGDYRRKNNDFYDDVTPVMALIKSGKQIAFVHSLSLYHHTIRDVHHFIKKQRWATQNALEGKKYGIKHRYKQLSDGQRLRMMLWPLYAVSFVFPLINSVFGLVRERKILWLFHPVECMLCAYANGMQLISYYLNKMGKNKIIYSRQ